MNVLVLDDEFQIASVIREVLEDHGHHCYVAARTDDAERLLAAVAVDALTLDQRMPGREGIDWLEELAVRTPHLARRTLLITGSDLDGRQRWRLARMGVPVLAKPFRIAELVAWIDSLEAAPPAG